MALGYQVNLSSKFVLVTRCSPLTAQPCSRQEVKFQMYQILDTLMYLHSQHVTHRDLKPQNILSVSKGTESYLKVGDFHIESVWQCHMKCFFAKNNSMSTLTLQLADFGLAKHTPQSTEMVTACGTILYWAPEMFQRDSYTNKVDAWSAGVIMYEW